MNLYYDSNVRISTKTLVQSIDFSYSAISLSMYHMPDVYYKYLVQATPRIFHFHFFWGLKYVSNVRDIYSSYKLFLPFMAGGALGPTAFMSGGVVGKLRERTDHFGGEHELDSTDTEASLVVGRREIHGGCTWPDGVHVAA